MKKQLDDINAPKSVNYDRRSLPKDERNLSNETTAMISGQASRKRRREWLESRRSIQVNTLQGDNWDANKPRKQNKISF